MKVLFQLLIACLFYTPSYCQYPFTININAPNINQSKINFFLMDYNRFKNIKSDSATLTDGRIQFEGQMKYPNSFARLTLKQGKAGFDIDFVIDSGKNDVTLGFINGNNKRLVLLNKKSKSNQIDSSLKEVIYRNFEKASKISGNVNEINSHSDLRWQMHLESNKELARYPDNFFSLIALYQLSHFDTSIKYAEMILATLNSFSDKLKNSSLGKEIYDEKSLLINNIKSSRTGNKVREFLVKDINGKIFKNSDLEGQNYIIAFSATWCIPCQVELPKLKRIYDTYKSKGLKVVYFNNDDNLTKWRNHIIKNKLEWINVSEGLKRSQSKIQRSFGVYAIPVCLLIDKSGTIIYNSDQNDIGIERLEDNIKKLY